MKPLAISYKPTSTDGTTLNSTVGQTVRNYRPQSSVFRPLDSQVPSTGDPEAILIKTLEMENKTLRDQITSILEREKLAKIESASLRDQLMETERRSSSLTDELSSVIAKEMGDLKMRLQMVQTDRDSISSQFELLKEKLTNAENELSGLHTGIDMLKTYYQSVSNDIMEATRVLCREILPAYTPTSISSGGLIPLTRNLELPVSNLPSSIQSCIHGIHGKVYELNMCFGDVRIAADAFKETGNIVKERLMKERDSARLQGTEYKVENDKLRDQMNMLRTDVDSVSRENDTIKPLFKSLQNENAGLKDELSALNDKLRQSQGETNILIRKIEALEAENTSLQATISVDKDQIAELRGAVTMFRLERDDATQRLTELEKNLIALTADALEENHVSRGAVMTAARPPPRVAQQSLRGHVDDDGFDSRAIPSHTSSDKSSPDNSRLINMIASGRLDDDRLSAALAQDRFERRSPTYYD